MVEEIRNSEFDDVLNSKLAVVDFSAVWCGPCQMLAPILEELSDEMDGEADFIRQMLMKIVTLHISLIFKAYRQS